MERQEASSAAAIHAWHQKSIWYARIHRQILFPSSKAVERQIVDTHEAWYVRGWSWAKKLLQHFAMHATIRNETCRYDGTSAWLRPTRKRRIPNTHAFCNRLILGVYRMLRRCCWRFRSCGLRPERC
jgi:hypothetical protein